MRIKPVIRRKALPRSRIDHPRCHEIPPCYLVGMLQLAPTALAEMAAWGISVMRTGMKGAVGRDTVACDRTREMPAICRYSVALRRNADDQGCCRKPV